MRSKRGPLLDDGRLLIDSSTRPLRGAARAVGLSDAKIDRGIVEAAASR
jgi:hypothetical protein